MSKIVIKSKFRTYQVDFVQDFTIPLKKEAEEGSFFVIDLNVLELYKNSIKSLLPENKFLIVEANENNKTLDKCKEIIEILVEKKVRRNQRLVAIGGGVIQDITAFTSSIIYRGVEWVFFPTTLLAQADSCIGSKTSINLGNKKNLIGNFYPPSNIYIDSKFLNSLTGEDIKSGIGEILHFYFYANSSFIKKLFSNYQTLLMHRTLLLEYMKESLSIKKRVAEIDEFDKGERNKFNYGHTFGHAIESLTNYQIKHGQAVTVGMDIANFISWKKNLMQKDIFNNIHSILKINFPVFDLKKLNLDNYFQLLSKDKKNIGENIGCILAEKPGKLIKKQIPLDENFKNLIRRYFNEIF